MLAERLGDPLLDAEGLVAAMLRPPLYSDRWERGFGTLYTAVYRPRQRSLELRWPAGRLGASIDAFESDSLRVALGPAPGPLREPDRFGVDELADPLAG